MIAVPRGTGCGADHEMEERIGMAPDCAWPGRGLSDAAAERPLHIAHIVFKLDFGGLENGLINLINRLPADRFRHSIVTLKPASDFRHRLCRTDVPVVEIGKRNGKDFGSYLRVWKALRG